MTLNELYGAYGKLQIQSKIINGRLIEIEKAIADQIQKERLSPPANKGEKKKP